VNTAGAVLRLL